MRLFFPLDTEEANNDLGRDLSGEEESGAEEESGGEDIVEEREGDRRNHYPQSLSAIIIRNHYPQSLSGS